MTATLYLRDDLVCKRMKQKTENPSCNYVKMSYPKFRSLFASKWKAGGPDVRHGEKKHECRPASVLPSPKGTLPGVNHGAVADLPGRGVINPPTTLGGFYSGGHAYLMSGGEVKVLSFSYCFSFFFSCIFL